MESQTYEESESLNDINKGLNPSGSKYSLRGDPMKLLALFSEITEFLDVAIALMILLYMWLRSHMSVKNKLHDLDGRLDEFDEYTSNKFGKIIKKLNKVEEVIEVPADPPIIKPETIEKE